MLFKVIFTWALLLGVVLYEVHASFTLYYVDKKKWKLAAHTILLFVFSVMSLQLGLFTLQMQFDAVQIPYPSFDTATAKRVVPRGHAPAVNSKAKRTAKK